MADFLLLRFNKTTIIELFAFYKETTRYLCYNQGGGAGYLKWVMQTLSEVNEMIANKTACFNEKFDPFAAKKSFFVKHLARIFVEQYI